VSYVFKEQEAQLKPKIKHWKPIGRSMTATPPVSSPSSIFSPSHHHIFFPARKNSARFTGVTISVV
jgi:hypothetical protein